MINPWLPVFLFLAAADWLAVGQGWRRIGYITKPASLIALLIWFGTVGHFQGSLLAFGFGLFFSLFGDVFLLLAHRFFIFGLAAFLLTHVSYVVAFNQPLPELSLPLYILGLAVFSVWLMIASRLERAISLSGAHARMRLPVAGYSVLIALMLFSALLTLFRPDWNPAAAVLAAGGGLLFFISDTMLAVDRFIHPFPNARFWVRVTYHLGQLALAAGFLMNHPG